MFLEPSIQCRSDGTPGPPCRKEPIPLDMFQQPILCAKKKGDRGGATRQDSYRDLILDLAAHIPLRLHGTFALHLAREKELLGSSHPGC